jgi:hypothetical protein
MRVAANDSIDEPHRNGSYSSSRLEIPQECRWNLQPLNATQTGLMRHSKAMKRRISANIGFGYQVGCRLAGGDAV